MMNDNEFEANENEIFTKDKIEPQQLYNLAPNLVESS